jgi:iron complex outermembrane receptor protein
MGKTCFKVILLILFNFYNSFGQSSDTLQLQELLVRGFDTKKSIIKTPAPVSILNLKMLNRYENTNLIPAFNSNPGVRLEERSPGSYRIALRGSSLRSPFNVRNVKVYWNGIPMTDAGGITYFNQLDINAIGRIEIMKGPSASLYGAGIGGVISINTKNARAGNEASASILAGSYGTVNQGYNFASGTKNNNLFVNVNLLKTNGYRDHSSVNKKSFNISDTYFSKSGRTYNFVAFISDFHYETPGGLTFEQYKNNPAASRPAAGPNPSSKEQNAGIYQTIAFLGMSEQMKYKNGWETDLSLFISGNNLKNPFITNYEQRKEFTNGGRWQIKKSWVNAPIKLWLGFETVDTQSSFDVFANNKGEKGLARYEDKVDSENQSLFIQSEYVLPYDIQILAGLSINRQNYEFKRNPILTTVAPINEKVNPGTPITPRISVLKSFKDKFSIFAAAGQGFSAPTATEMVSTASFGVVNTILKAEKAMNYEAGLKFADNQNQIEISYFNQLINNALVRKLNDGGNEYFLNTGKISQKGLETLLKREWVKKANISTINSIITSLSYTFNNFIYKEYESAGTSLEGKQLPGSPRHNVYFLSSFSTKFGISLNFDLNYLSEIPLNDANTFFSETAIISQSRLEYFKKIKKIGVIIFASFNNIFNEKYSAGYDFNAFGNRFYNSSAPRNYNGGLRITYSF